MNRHKLKVESGDHINAVEAVELNGLEIKNSVKAINIDLQGGRAHQATITLLGRQSIELAASIAVRMDDDTGRLGELMSQAMTESWYHARMGEKGADSSLATRFLELLIEQSGSKGE